MSARAFDRRQRDFLKLPVDAPAIVYSCELKYDGLAVSLRYEKGRLCRVPPGVTAR
ncbi:MAG: hypothetical protein R3E68_17570 [Burkholderiaceae bacterium]